MLTAAHVVPSAVQNSTQTNREICPEIAFKSKAELRKYIESMALELRRFKEENRKLRTQVLGFQTKDINSNRGQGVLMKVAV
jgi:hypothetical protein